MNNKEKTTKIIIGAAVAIVVIAIIILVYTRGPAKEQISIATKCLSADVQISNACFNSASKEIMFSIEKGGNIINLSRLQIQFFGDGESKSIDLKNGQAEAVFENRQELLGYIWYALYGNYKCSTYKYYYGDSKDISQIKGGIYLGCFNTPADGCRKQFPTSASAAIHSPQTIFADFIKYDCIGKPASVQLPGNNEEKRYVIAESAVGLVSNSISIRPIIQIDGKDNLCSVVSSVDVKNC